jgi:ABC-type transporter Mla subunit MlaD
MSKKINTTSIGLFIVTGVALGVTGLLLFSSSKMFSKTHDLIVYFNESLNGLNEGAPVKYRGVTVGSVKRVMARFNQATNDDAMPVIIEIEDKLVQRRLGDEAGKLFYARVSSEQVREERIKQGLRVSLQTESLVTGVLYVDMQVDPKAPPPVFHQLEKIYAELPAEPTEIKQLFNNLASLDIKSLQTNLNGLITRLDTTVGELKMADINAGVTNLLVSGDANAADPVKVQEVMFRFAGEFATHVILDLDKLGRGTNAPAYANVLRWKISLTSEIISIASGPNAVVNLLDMTAFVTVMRASLEEHWVPKVFGESAQPMLDTCRIAEKKIWQLADDVITREQQEELRAAIGVWHRQNPHPDNVLAARSIGITLLAEAVHADTKAPASVFRLLRIDPMSGLDPATREITQTRLFAERALHVAQWMPTLLRWQIEFMSLNAAAMPEVQQLVTNSTQIAASVDRFAVLAEKLPGQVSAEREAIVKDLQTQEKQLTPLVDQVRQTLTAGTQMSTSLNTTIGTFDSLMKRFGVGETNSAGAPDKNSQPFQILDYAQTATHMESMARQLTELVRTLDQTLGDTNLTRLSAQVGPVVQQAQAGGREIVILAFWMGVLAMAIALVFALTYRFLSPRLTPATRSATSSP